MYKKNLSQQTIAGPILESNLYKFINDNLHSSTLRQFNKHKQLDDIESLYLTGKNIRAVPEKLLSQLPNLKVIWLNGNAIDKISKWIEDVPNIEELYLNNNQVDKLQGYQQCKKLSKLNLSYNLIHSIPNSPSWQFASTLKQLLLSQNKICSIQSLCHYQFPSLRSLYLSGNNICTALCLRRLQAPNLKYLYLDGNKITDFYRYEQIWNKRRVKIENQNDHENAKCYINMVNLQQTLDDEKVTCLKVGVIFGAKAKWKANFVIFK